MTVWKGVDGGLDPPLAPFEGNWNPEFTAKERVYLEQRVLTSPE